MTCLYCELLGRVMVERIWRHKEKLWCRCCFALSIILRYGSQSVICSQLASQFSQSINHQSVSHSVDPPAGQLGPVRTARQTGGLIPARPGVQACLLASPLCLSACLPACLSVCLSIIQMISDLVSLHPAM